MVLLLTDPATCDEDRRQRASHHTACLGQIFPRWSYQLLLQRYRGRARPFVGALLASRQRLGRRMGWPSREVLPGKMELGIFQTAGQSQAGGREKSSCRRREISSKRYGTHGNGTRGNGSSLHWSGRMSRRGPHCVAGGGEEGEIVGAGRAVCRGLRFADIFVLPSGGLALVFLAH